MPVSPVWLNHAGLFVTDLARAERFYAQVFGMDWDTLAADDFAAAMRTESGSNPRDRALNSLIGDLAAGSAEFSTRWARHNVRFHRTARKTMRNPIVGEIELTGDALELPGEGLTMIAYSAEPGSQAQEKLDFLASWSAGENRPGLSPNASPVLPGPAQEDN
ncbi:MmyB family transcriptional regulator [Pseudarthrobacter phenanthrenivorans]|nr:VOC family protein [Pseudarthrobacter phenanthrenivorans]